MSHESNFGDAVELFNMRINNKISEDDLKDTKKRDDILKKLRRNKSAKKKLELNTIKNSGMEL